MKNNNAENNDKLMMDRRQILKTSSMLIGYALTAGTTAAILNGCKADTTPTWTPSFLDSDQFAILSEVAEMIIPETDIPGAKGAYVDRFMDSMLECYSPEERQEFIEGLSLFDVKSTELNKTSFVKANAEQRKAVLDAMVSESKTSEEPHIWNIVKGATVAGYCRSEVGATQLLIYDPVPGPFVGCVDFKTVGGTYAL